MECNVVGENLVSALQVKYPTVSVGIGKLKDYKLKLLHVDNTRNSETKACPICTAREGN